MDSIDPQGAGLRAPRLLVASPRSEPAQRDALRAWLAFQARYALRPEAGLEWLRRAGAPAPLAAGAPPCALPESAADTALAVLERLGASALPHGAAEYPARLARLVDAPPLLLLRGRVDALAAPCVAFVGSRAATRYGIDATRRLAGPLAAAGIAIVSGLAVGIDAAAHEAALEAGGRTIGVLACGIDRVYPARHRALAERITECGAILGELPPGTPPLPPYFPLRNRLISALSMAVVVVEARERSGSLLTAHHAANQGVDVYAVPGPIFAPTSRGTNRLIGEGAGVACDADELLGALVAGGAIPTRPLPGGEAQPGADAAHLTAGQREILSALAREACSRDRLGELLGRPPQGFAADLIELELGGRIALDRDGRLHLRAYPPDREPIA